MVGNSLVTTKDIAHDVAPLKLLDIALDSVVNSSPTKTHGIGLKQTFEWFSLNRRYIVAKLLKIQMQKAKTLTQAPTKML